MHSFVILYHKDKTFACFRMSLIVTELRVANERIVLQEDSTTETIAEANAETRLCTDAASVTEYHVLVKDSE